jgi:hypothetical protein
MVHARRLGWDTYRHHRDPHHRSAGAPLDAPTPTAMIESPPGSPGGSQPSGQLEKIVLAIIYFVRRA